MLIAAIALGVGIGLAVGTLGGGGAVLAVPVLVYLLGQDVEQATTASLIVVAAGSLAGGLGHARERRVCWRHAGSFTAAAVPGIVAGTLAGNAVSGSLIVGAFSLILLAAAAVTWRRADGGDDEGWQPGGDTCPPLRLPRDLVAGASIGFLTGFFGVGGGFLIVPTLAIALAFTMRTAVGTSLAIITATSLIALGAHLVAGRTLDAEVTAALAGGCAAGAVVGSALSQRVPQQALGRAFAALVAVVALYLVVSVSLLGGPPGGS